MDKDAIIDLEVPPIVEAVSSTTSKVTELPLELCNHLTEYFENIETFPNTKEEFLTNISDFMKREIERLGGEKGFSHGFIKAMQESIDPKNMNDTLYAAAIPDSTYFDNRGFTYLETMRSHRFNW